MELFSNPEIWISLLTLTFLEIVLGIDNIIFISIISDRLPEEEQKKARTIGLSLAIAVRVLLLLGISYLVHFTNPLFTVFGKEISIKDLILIVGGLFLLSKSTSEVHNKIEGETHEEHAKNQKGLTVRSAITQIILLDIVFSFDSILTAVGLANEVIIMIIAVVISLGIMLLFAKKISDFINKNPTVKMLALAFLLMIGTLLILDGVHIEVPKGYIYFSLAFSLFVEFLNHKLKKKNPKKMNRDEVENEKEI